MEMRDEGKQTRFHKGSGGFAATLGGAAASGAATSADGRCATAWPETDVLVVGGHLRRIYALQ